MTYDDVKCIMIEGLKVLCEFDCSIMYNENTKFNGQLKSR